MKLMEGVIEPVLETERIKRAFEFAYRMHERQRRSTGEPYINHPIRVANYVREFKRDSTNYENLVVAALLHDTIEDTTLIYYDIVEFFGPTVASIVLELTTDKDLKNAVGKTRYLEIKVKNMSSWALTIKLCDRLDNCSDLDMCSEEFRVRYTIETVSVLEYLLANRSVNDTHKRIIARILAKLGNYIGPDDVELTTRLSELAEKVTIQKEKTLEFARVVDMKDILISRF